MELFVLFSIFFSFCNPLLGVEAGFRVWDCSTALIVSLCLYAVIYVFKAIALSTMAKNAGKDKLVWCAFVPVASTYLIGELAGDTRFFNHTFKKIGLIAMITEIVVILAFLCSYVPQYYIIDGGYYLEPVKGSGGLQIVDSVPLWLFNLYKVGDIVYSILSWIYLFVFVFLYIAIFRTYYARGHVLFTIISALFPVSAFRHPQQSRGQLRKIYAGADGAHAPRTAGKSLQSVRQYSLRAGLVQRRRACSARRSVRRIFFPRQERGGQEGRQRPRRFL